MFQEQRTTYVHTYIKCVLHCKANKSVKCALGLLIFPTAGLHFFQCFFGCIGWCQCWNNNIKFRKSVSNLWFHRFQANGIWREWNAHGHCFGTQSVSFLAHIALLGAHLSSWGDTMQCCSAKKGHHSCLKMIVVEQQTISFDLSSFVIGHNDNIRACLESS